MMLSEDFAVARACNSLPNSNKIKVFKFFLSLKGHSPDPHVSARHAAFEKIVSVHCLSSSQIEITSTLEHTIVQY